MRMEAIRMHTTLLEIKRKKTYGKAMDNMEGSNSFRGMWRPRESRLVEEG